MQQWNSRPKSRRGKVTQPRGVKTRERPRGWRVIDVHRQVDQVRVVKMCRWTKERDFDAIERETWTRHLNGIVSVHLHMRKR